LIEIDGEPARDGADFVPWLLEQLKRPRPVVAKFQKAPPMQGVPRSIVFEVEIQSGPLGVSFGDGKATKVSPGQAADAGVEVGDVLLDIGGEPAKRGAEFVPWLSEQLQRPRPVTARFRKNPGGQPSVHVVEVIDITLHDGPLGICFSAGKAKAVRDGQGRDAGVEAGDVLTEFGGEAAPEGAAFAPWLTGQLGRPRPIAARFQRMKQI